MSEIYLYTTFYKEHNEDRRSELLFCLNKNLSNPQIAKVVVFNESGDLSSVEHNGNLIIFKIESRPKYSDFIENINSRGEKDIIHIVANTDIFFDENIAVLRKISLRNVCLALARWDTTESYKPILFNHNDSQDVWIFRGRIKKTLTSDYPIGVPRCDNRFMFDLQESGYIVQNPAFSIKAYHKHAGQRLVVYKESDNKYDIKGPYRYLYPHNQFGLIQTLLFNLKNQFKLGEYKYDIKKMNNWLPLRVIRKCFELITGKVFLIGYHQPIND